MSKKLLIRTQKKKILILAKILKLNKKDNISDNNFESLSFDDSNISYQSEKKNSNNNENIFICKQQIKKKRNSICFFKRVRRVNKDNNKKFQICQNIIIKIGSYYENLNMITNGKISKINKFQAYFKKMITNKLLKNKEKEENFNSQNLPNSTNIKYIRPKSMAKKITTKIGKNNLYKVSHAEKKLKITDVKNTFQKPLNSQVQDKKYTTKTKKSIINIDDLNDSSQNSSSNNFIAKRGKTKKK